MSGQGQGQPTQSGQGQQGLGGYGPQLSDPYQGQPYGLSSQSQQANPFAAGATSTPAPTTQYNSPYGGTAYGATTSAAPSVKMPQTAIASYGRISVANMQRAGFGFANPFSQPAGQAQPVLPVPQQSQQPTWTGPTQPSPLPQAWQGQGGANVNSPSSVKVEPPRSSRSSMAGQQSYGGVPGYWSNGSPYVNSNERQPVFGMPSSIKNAVRVIQPFYSDGATIEKARAFWDSFEMATIGLSDTIRLSAFRECLKGKTGEDWWMYSQISDFETLRRSEFEGVLRDEGADNCAPNMYETTNLEVNTNGFEDEGYDAERPTWGQDEEGYNETAPVSVVSPKFGGVLPTDDVGNWERSAIPGAVATDAASSTDTGSAKGEGKGVDEGVFPVDDVNDATESAVQKDRSAEGPSKAQEEQDDGHIAQVVTEEVVRDEGAVFDDDWDWEDCFRDEYVGHLGCGFNPGKEKECDEVSTLPVEATSNGEDEMKRPIVEAKGAMCARAPPSHGGELVERSEPAEEGEHSDDEDPADEVLGTLSADAEMIRAGVEAGVAEAGPASQPQVKEDRSEDAMKNAPPLHAGCDPVPVADEVDESVARGNILICVKGTGTAVSTPKADSDKEDSTETTRVEALPAQYRRLLADLHVAGWRPESGPKWPASKLRRTIVSPGGSSPW
ncbi:hypothetical protein PF008_g7832 [Phytophthora fragariae]|uniref:Uncharacterized protein n=1 Tax=Phytophthora fragariae TaxID=53985 RepID=A0A6G0S1X7_9STRA|nr:hypothetical protein PF008_g7832 [Phytophthora fragariae]